MAQVIIDRGYYKIGCERADGTVIQEAGWVSDENATGIAIGIEGKEFGMYSIYDRRQIIKQIFKLLAEKQEK